MISDAGHHAEGVALPKRHWHLREDCEKGYRIGLRTRTPSFSGKLKAWLWQLEIPCVAVYRLGQLAQTLHREHVAFAVIPYAIYVVLQAFVRLVLHVEISPRCEIGPGFHLGHPYSIIIGPTRIGSNCNVTHGVTIGMGLSAGRGGVPTIGNNVWIGPNSVLTGPIHIGDGATVGAGSIVTRDVPPGALVMGNPARVVLAEYDNAALLDLVEP
ncbi:serine O-acetyltransferase [Vulgatibacter incomptus]|nr:serine acetyltransferase [Vulgatibacter incomptus]